MASIYGAVSATGWRLRLDYTVSQDAAENRSTLALALYIYDGTGESYNQAANSCRYVLQGKTVYQPYRYESKGWYKLGSGSVTVDHRSDGSGRLAGGVRTMALESNRDTAKPGSRVSAMDTREALHRKKDAESELPGLPCRSCAWPQW